MSELNDQNQQPVAAPPVTAQGLSAPPAPPEPPVVAHKKHSYVADGFKSRTKGEALFNFTSYFGVGYLGVTGFSVLMSWLLRDNKHVAPVYQKLVNSAIKLTKGHKEGEALTKHIDGVNSIMTITALFTGGTIMSVLPIKWMEDNKATLVKGFDHVFYGKEKAESDPTIVAAHADLAAAPKQTWMSVLGARLLAFAATYSTSLIIGSNNSLIGKHGISIDKAGVHAGRWLDGAIHHKHPEIVAAIDEARQLKPNDLLREGDELLKEGKGKADRTFSRIASYVSLDAIYTGITSTALFVFTRVLAPVFDKNVREREKEEKLEQFLPATPTTQSALATSAAPQARISQAEPAGRIVQPQAELAV